MPSCTGRTPPYRPRIEVDRGPPRVETPATGAAEGGARRHGPHSENPHGTIRTEGIQEGRARDAQDEGRHASQRWLGPQGQEQEAGRRDRPLRGASRWRQSPESIVFIPRILVALAGRFKLSFQFKLSLRLKLAFRISERFLASFLPLSNAPPPCFSRELSCMAVCSRGMRQARKHTRTSAMGPKPAQNEADFISVSFWPHLNREYGARPSNSPGTGQFLRPGVPAEALPAPPPNREGLRSLSLVLDRCAVGIESAATRRAQPIAYN